VLSAIVVYTKVSTEVHRTIRWTEFLRADIMSAS
jgi:hypothetical protein